MQYVATMVRRAFSSFPPLSPQPGAAVAGKKILVSTPVPDVISVLVASPAHIQCPVFEIGSRAVIARPPVAALALLDDTLKAVGESQRAQPGQAVGSVQWELFRMDIHGTEVSMAVFGNQAEADATAKMYQDRWVQ